MESSAWVYVALTVLTVALGLCIDNQRFVPGYLQGGRPYGASVGCDNQLARNRIAMFAIYVLLTGVSACRIAVGNDYWVYRDNFKLIAQERHVSSEFGFNYIVKWIQQLFGYDNYIPVFAFFSIVTVFFFVRSIRDQGENFAFSLFLLLTGGYYFHSLNSVRYYLALAIAMFAMKFVLRKEYGKFVLWILVGAMFHKSIFLVIPVYLVAGWLAGAPLKKWHYGVGIAGLLSLIFGQNVYREIIFMFYPYYRDSMFDRGEISYANIAKCVCVLALCLLCYKKSLRQSRVNRFYFFLNLFALVVYCCGSFIPEVSRIGYYMMVSQIFLLPNLLSGMENGWMKRLCQAGVVLAFSAYFGLLLKDMYSVDIRLLPYLNWIFN